MKRNRLHSAPIILSLSHARVQSQSDSRLAAGSQAGNSNGDENDHPVSSNTAGGGSNPHMSTSSSSSFSSPASSLPTSIATADNEGHELHPQAYTLGKEDAGITDRIYQQVLASQDSEQSPSQLKLFTGTSKGTGLINLARPLPPSSQRSPATSPATGPGERATLALRGGKLVSPRKKPAASRGTNRIAAPDQHATAAAPSPYKQRLDAIISRRATNDYLERQASKAANNIEPGSFLICTPPWPHCQEELAAQYAQHLQNAQIRELAREPQQFQHGHEAQELGQDQPGFEGLQRFEPIPHIPVQLERQADPSLAQTQGNQGAMSSQAGDQFATSRICECEPNPAGESAETPATPAKRNKNQSKAKRIKRKKEKRRAAQIKEAHLQDVEANAHPDVARASGSSSRSRSPCSSASTSPASRHITRASSLGDNLPPTLPGVSEMAARTPGGKDNAGSSSSREPVRLSLKLPPTNIVASEREAARQSKQLSRHETALGTRRPTSHARLPSASAAALSERPAAGISHGRSASRPLAQSAADRQENPSRANPDLVLGADSASGERDPPSTSERDATTDSGGRHRKNASISRAQKAKQRSKVAKEKASASQQTQQIAEIVSAAERGELVISSPKKIGSVRDGKSARSAVSIALLSANDAPRALAPVQRGHKQGPANDSRESFEGCPSKADTEESFESAKSGLLSSSAEYATAFPADSPRRSWSPSSPISDTPRRLDVERTQDSVKTVKQAQRCDGAADRDQGPSCHSATPETTPEGSRSRFVPGTLGSGPFGKESQAALRLRIDELKMSLAYSQAKPQPALEITDAYDHAHLPRTPLDSDLCSRLPTLLDDMTDWDEEAIAVHRAKLEDTIFRTESWRRETENAKAAVSGGHLTPSESSVWWSSPDGSSTKSSTDDTKTRGSWDEPYDPSPDPFMVKSVEARLPRRVVKAMSDLFRGNSKSLRGIKGRKRRIDLADMDLNDSNHRAALIDQVQGLPTFEHVHSRTSMARKVRLSSLSRFDLEHKEWISHLPPPSQGWSPLKRTISEAPHFATNTAKARNGQSATVSPGNACRVGPTLRCGKGCVHGPLGLQLKQRHREDSFGLTTIDYHAKDGLFHFSGSPNIGPSTPPALSSDSHEHRRLQGLFPTAVDSRCLSPFSEDLSSEADDQDEDVSDRQWVESLASLHPKEVHSIAEFFEQGQRFWEMCREFWDSKPQEQAPEDTGEPNEQRRRIQAHGHQDEWEDATASILEAHASFQAKDDSFAITPGNEEPIVTSGCHLPASTMLPPEIASTTTPMQHFIFRRQPKSNPGSGSLNGIAGTDAKFLMRAVKQQLGKGCTTPLSPPQRHCTEARSTSPQSRASDDVDAYRVSRAIQVLPQEASPGQQEREATKLRLVQEAYEAYRQRGGQQAQAVTTGWHGWTKAGKSNARPYRRHIPLHASSREGQASLRTEGEETLETHEHRSDAIYGTRFAQKPSTAWHGAKRNAFEQMAMQAGPLDCAPYGMVANIANPRTHNEQVVQQAAQQFCGSQRADQVSPGSSASAGNIRITRQSAQEFFPHPPMPVGAGWDMAGSGDESALYDQHYVTWLSSVGVPSGSSSEGLIGNGVVSREAYLNDRIDYTTAVVVGAGGRLSTTAGHWAACAPMLTPMYDSFGTWDDPVSPQSGATTGAGNEGMENIGLARSGSSDSQCHQSLRPSEQRTRQSASPLSEPLRRYHQEDHRGRESRVNVQNGPCDRDGSR